MKTTEEYLRVPYYCDAFLNHAKIQNTKGEILKEQKDTLDHRELNNYV